MSEKKLVKTFSDSFPAAQAVRLEEMIAVSPDAVVSRTLAKGEAGTLTLFAFDAGQKLSEHTAPFDAFVQVLDGRLELTIGGEAVADKRDHLRVTRDGTRAVWVMDPLVDVGCQRVIYPAQVGLGLLQHLEIMLFQLRAEVRMQDIHAG